VGFQEAAVRELSPAVALKSGAVLPTRGAAAFTTTLRLRVQGQGGRAVRSISACCKAAWEGVLWGRRRQHCPMAGHDNERSVVASEQSARAASSHSEMA
jgi:hypothetical protein